MLCNAVIGLAQFRELYLGRDLNRERSGENLQKRTIMATEEAVRIVRDDSGNILYSRLLKLQL